ncbi:MAG: hypothetical protein FWC26_00895 [Fibromonadales bacterium]|nr:hypothetical protein [Fibromonadales bacterium]
MPPRFCALLRGVGGNVTVNIESFFCDVKGQGSFCKHSPLATNQAMKSELILIILKIL